MARGIVCIEENPNYYFSLLGVAQKQDYAKKLSEFIPSKTSSHIVTRWLHKLEDHNYLISIKEPLLNIRRFSINYSFLAEQFIQRINNTNSFKDVKPLKPKNYSNNKLLKKWLEECLINDLGTSTNTINSFFDALSQSIHILKVERKLKGKLLNELILHIFPDFSVQIATNNFKKILENP